MSVVPSETGSTRLRVLLVDVCPVVGERLREALLRLPEIELVGPAVTSAEALALFFNRRPDLVIMSVLLPELGGFETLRCMKRAIPACTVILTSQYTDEFVQQAASFLGAAAVCLLDDESVQIRRLLARFIGRKPDGE